MLDGSPGGVIPSHCSRYLRVMNAIFRSNAGAGSNWSQGMIISLPSQSNAIPALILTLPPVVSDLQPGDHAKPMQTAVMTFGLLDEIRLFLIEILFRE